MEKERKIDPYVLFWVAFLSALVVWNLAPAHKVLLTILAIIASIFLTLRLLYWKQVERTLEMFALQKELVEALNKQDFEKLMELYPKLMKHLPEQYKKQFEQLQSLSGGKGEPSLDSLFGPLMEGLFTQPKKSKKSKTKEEDKKEKEE